MIEIGTRVKVTIPDDKAHTWARNYLVAVQGLTGVVLEKEQFAQNTKDAVYRPRCLVQFDVPPLDPSPLAKRERKLTQFWIQDHSLTEVES